MHRRTALLALLVASALVASACTGRGTEAAPPAGGWQVVTPPGVLASDLFARAGEVLVGGVSAGPGPAAAARNRTERRLAGHPGHAGDRVRRPGGHPARVDR